MPFKCWTGLTKHPSLWKENPKTRSRTLWTQDPCLQQAVSLIEGLLALRSAWGLVLRYIVFFTFHDRLALFLPSDLWRYSQAISNILQDLLSFSFLVFLLTSGKCRILRGTKLRWRWSFPSSMPDGNRYVAASLEPRGFLSLRMQAFSWSFIAKKDR